MKKNSWRDISLFESVTQKLATQCRCLQRDGGRQFKIHNVVGYLSFLIFEVNVNV